MSNLKGLSKDDPEFKALSDADWNQWLEMAQTRRLVGSLQESQAAHHDFMKRAEGLAIEALGRRSAEDLLAARAEYVEHKTSGALIGHFLGAFDPRIVVKADDIDIAKAAEAAARAPGRVTVVDQS